MLGATPGTAVFNLAMSVTVVSTVLALGLRLSPQHLVGRLKPLSCILAVVAVNVIAIPALALWLGRVLPVSSAATVGVALVAAGSAGPAVLKAAQISRFCDMALALVLVVLLQIVNVVAVPIWAGIIAPGVGLSPLAIVTRLAILVLLPLALGQVLRGPLAHRAPRWTAALSTAGTIALAVGLVTGIAVNWSTITPLLGSGVLPLSLLIIVAGIAAGAALPWADGTRRAAAGLVSGTRFSALGLIVISTELRNMPDYLGPAILFTLTELLVITGLAIALARRAAPAETLSRSVGTDS